MEEPGGPPSIAGEDASDGDPLTAAPFRLASQQPNEKLLSHVNDFSLAHRLLNVRIYQIFHSSTTSSGGVAECVGYRVAATDEVENDYALFLSRAKGDELFQAQSPSRGDVTPEAIASSILTHLNIIGNRHRDAGRLVCREPEATLGKKERAAPRPKTPSKRNAHLPTKEQDKRTSRNKQSQQRALEAIAASHDQPQPRAEQDADTAGLAELIADNTSSTLHHQWTGGALGESRKSRKSSEAGLLHRMANANATTVWRSELEGFDDEAGEEEAEEDDEASVDDRQASHDSVSSSASSPSYKRALPERKTRYKGLQERRDNERKQRFHVSKVVPRTPSPETNGLLSSRDGAGASSATHPAASSPPRHRQSNADVPRVAASAAIGNANALRTCLVETPPEQERFLRRKTIHENDKRVFKVEGIFDEAMGVEITLERPVHTPQKNVSQKRKTSKKTATRARQSLSGSVSEPVLPSWTEPVKVSPRPELVAHATSGDGGVSEQTACGEDGERVDLAHVGVRAEEEAQQEVGEDGAGEGGECGDDVSDLEDEELARHGSVETVGDEVGKEEQSEDHPDPWVEVEQHTPRLARHVDIIYIHEDEPQDVREEDQTTARLEQENGEEAEDEPTGQDDARDLDQPLVGTPRVECWEEEVTGVETDHAETNLVGLPEEKPAWVSSSEHQEATPTATQDAYTTVLAEGDGVETEAETVGEGLDTEPELPTEATDSKGPVQDPNANALPLLDDPIVEVELPRALAPNEPENIIEDIIREVKLPQPQPKKDASPIVVEDKAPPVKGPMPSPSLRRPLNRAATRRTSIVEVQNSVIAAAAAAAAAMASVAKPVDLPPAQPKHSPKNNDLGHRNQKRRSHDGTPGLVSSAGSAGSRRDGPRRSTLHIFHGESPIKAAGAVVEPHAAADGNTGLKENGDIVLPAQAPSKAHNDGHDVQHNPHDLHVDAHPHHKQRSKEEIELLQKSPSYHAKWHRWANGKQLLDKVNCLQLEEQVLQDPHDLKSLLKLGLRYARLPATSLAAVLLLEHATVIHDGGTVHTHEYWNSLGNAHFDVFLRHRKFLPIATFHLATSLQAFTRAFAYLESLADPLLLLRYAICLYWKKGGGAVTNLERADDIFRELLSKFASFCDKDRPNLLFLHFQILCRLKMFGEAIDCLHKVLVLYDGAQQQQQQQAPAPSLSQAEAPTSCVAGAPEPYDVSDYLLMLMHCQQASGDFLQASATFSQLLRLLHAHNSGIPIDGSTLNDDDYLHMWGALADKCFQHEDYSLAIEFYAITATYAKDSRVLARMLYNHALCYQAVGEGIKCSAEFKRAKNINRHVAPFATLADIHARYDDHYTALLHMPIPEIIEEVRQSLYDRAVTALQRIFRRKKLSQDGQADASATGATSSSMPSGGIRAGTDRRHQSVIASLTQLAEGAGNSRGSVGTAGLGRTKGDGNGAPADPREVFDQRRAAAMQKLEKLRQKPPNKVVTAGDVKAKTPKRTQSGLLSPVADRPDLRRNHSVDSLAKRLGYVPVSRAQYVGHWELLVVTAMDLYETRSAFYRHIAKIRSILPLVSEAVAACALADALGDADRALERLHEAAYEQELQLVCDVVDVPSILQQRLTASSDHSQPTRFPPIKSPTKTPSPSPAKPSPSPIHAPSSVSLPPCTPPSNQNRTTVRLSSLIDSQFQSAVTSQITESGDSAAVKKLHEVDRFEVVDDFRAVNESLLHGWQQQ